MVEDEECDSMEHVPRGGAVKRVDGVGGTRAGPQEEEGNAALVDAFVGGEETQADERGEPVVYGGCGGGNRSAGVGDINGVSCVGYGIGGVGGVGDINGVGCVGYGIGDVCGSGVDY